MKKLGGKTIIAAVTLELAPAVIFGSAVGYASSAALSLKPLEVIPLSGGAGAFVVSWFLLRLLGARPAPLPLADFDQSDLEREMAALAEEMQQAEETASYGPAELEELVLDEESPASEDDELVLEDPVAESEADSRVVRLFDPAKETAGEMQSRIDRHLRSTQRPPLSDATQELHDALSALRQSLR